MEYDSNESLLPTFPDIYLTKQRGFQLQYDLQTDVGKCVFECKRLKGISWNQAEAFFTLLERVKPEGYKPYLLFKSNRQPCLVMYRKVNGNIIVMKFEDVFLTPFIKHTPIKRGIRRCP